MSVGKIIGLVLLVAGALFAAYGVYKVIEWLDTELNWTGIFRIIAGVTGIILGRYIYKKAK